jgi:hypothetical protein
MAMKEDGSPLVCRPACVSNKKRELIHVLSTGSFAQGDEDEEGERSNSS